MGVGVGVKVGERVAVGAKRAGVSVGVEGSDVGVTVGSSGNGDEHAAVNMSTLNTASIDAHLRRLTSPYRKGQLPSNTSRPFTHHATKSYIRKRSSFTRLGLKKVVPPKTARKTAIFCKIYNTSYHTTEVRDFQTIMHLQYKEREAHMPRALCG